MEKVVDIRYDELEDGKCIITFDSDGNIYERKFDFNLNSKEILEYISKYKAVLIKKIDKIKTNSPNNTFKRKVITHLCMTPYYLLMLVAAFGFGSGGVGSLSIASFCSILALIGGAMFVHNNDFLHVTPKERKRIQSYKAKKRECSSIEKEVAVIISNRISYENSKRDNEDALAKARERQEQKDLRRQEIIKLKREKEELLKKREQELQKKEALRKANLEKKIVIENNKVINRRDIKVGVLNDNLKEINSEMVNVLKQIVNLEQEAEKRGISLDKLEKDRNYLLLTSRYESLNRQMQLLTATLEQVNLKSQKEMQDINNLRR